MRITGQARFQRAATKGQRGPRGRRALKNGESKPGVETHRSNLVTAVVLCFVQVPPSTPSRDAALPNGRFWKVLQNTDSTELEQTEP